MLVLGAPGGGGGGGTDVRPLPNKLLAPERMEEEKPDCVAQLQLRRPQGRRARTPPTVTLAKKSAFFSNSIARAHAASGYDDDESGGYLGSPAHHCGLWALACVCCQVCRLLDCWDRTRKISAVVQRSSGPGLGVSCECRSPGA